MVNKIIKELSALYPDFKFSKSSTTYQAEAIINVRCKEGAKDLAYYAGDTCGYCPLSSELEDIEKYIKAALPEYRVIDFIDGNRKGHFEIHN